MNTEAGDARRATLPHELVEQRIRPIRSDASDLEHDTLACPNSEDDTGTYQQLSACPQLTIVANPSTLEQNPRHEPLVGGHRRNNDG